MSLMLSLFPLTLAALCWRSSLLVRTTALRVWQGVRCFCHCRWPTCCGLAGCIRVRSARGAARRRLPNRATRRVIASLKVQEPALWQLLNRELPQHKLAEGVRSRAGHMRGWLMDLVNQRMARASDAAIINHIRVSGRRCRRHSSRMYSACFRFYPQVSGGVNRNRCCRRSLISAMVKRSRHCCKTVPAMSWRWISLSGAARSAARGGKLYGKCGR